MRGGKQPSIGKDWLYLLFLIRVYFPRKRITRSQIITRLFFRNSLRSSAPFTVTLREKILARERKFKFENFSSLDNNRISALSNYYFPRILYFRIPDYNGSARPFRWSNLDFLIKLFSAKTDYILQSQIPTQLLLSVVAKFISIQCTIY